MKFMGLLAGIYDRRRYGHLERGGAGGEGGPDGDGGGGGGASDGEPYPDSGGDSERDGEHRHHANNHHDHLHGQRALQVHNPHQVHKLEHGKGGGVGNGLAGPMGHDGTARSRRRTDRTAGEYDVGDADDEEDGEAAAGQARRRGPKGGGRGAAGPRGGGTAGEDYVIACPCGVKYDDGQMMIECEECAAWAHLHCLKEQMAREPARVQYNFETYTCIRCQRALQQQELGGSGAQQQAYQLGQGQGPGQEAGQGLQRGRRRKPGGRSGAGAGPGIEGDGVGDSGSEDSQVKASELSSILLGLANGRLGNGRVRGQAGRGGSGGGLQGAGSADLVQRAGGQVGAGTGALALPRSASGPAGAAAGARRAADGTANNGSKGEPGGEGPESEGTGGWYLEAPECKGWTGAVMSWAVLYRC